MSHLKLHTDSLQFKRADGCRCGKPTGQVKWKKNVSKKDKGALNMRKPKLRWKVMVSKRNSPLGSEKHGCSCRIRSPRGDLGVETYTMNKSQAVAMHMKSCRDSFCWQGLDFPWTPIHVSLLKRLTLTNS